MILIGFVFLYINHNKTLEIPIILFILVGFYELLKTFYSKMKWIQERRKSKFDENEVKITFTDYSIISCSAYSSGEMLWTGIRSICTTQKGIIIRPENGILFYIPKSVFNNSEDIEWIISKTQPKK